MSNVNQELLEALTGLLDDIEGLIAESDGVYGLHLNGAPAPWDEIVEGGRFEWLTHISAARAAIAKANTQAAEPALLAALEDITGEAAFTGLPESKQEAIYAAIAKARGES